MFYLFFREPTGTYKLQNYKNQEFICTLYYRNRRYGNDHYDKTDASYSRKVKQARQAKNLTQEELGES